MPNIRAIAVPALDTAPHPLDYFDMNICSAYHS